MREPLLKADTLLRYAEPEVVFRTGSFYYPIIVNRNYFFVICPRKEVKVVFSRGVFFHIYSISA